MKSAMTDQTPEARAVDFHDADINALWDEAVQQRLGEAGSVLIRTVMPKMQAALDERAADLALVEKVRALEPGESLTVGVANPLRWRAATSDDKVIFWADTPAEAIALLRAAKEAERG